jgi:hypothetical protein
MKHKRPKTMELRSTEKDRIRRKGKWRIVLLAVCAVIVAAALITLALTLHDKPPVDPNAARKAVPAAR